MSGQSYNDRIIMVGRDPPDQVQTLDWTDRSDGCAAIQRGLNRLQ